MKTLYNKKMSDFTTVKIGGNISALLVPENTNELVDIVRENKTDLFLGGGSNILPHDDDFDTVVSLREFNKTIQCIGEGRYKVGASVRLQELIERINEDGYGGIEYLITVPGLVGGAIAMNAGGSREEGYSISDCIKNVECICKGTLVELPIEECEFGYRDSKFKRDKSIIITSATFQFKEQSMEESLKLRNNKLKFCRELQDTSSANFGSVFAKCDPIIMKFFRHLQIKKKSGVHLSYKTDNWICNSGEGSFKDAIRIINIIKFVHALMNKACELEVVIWDPD